MPIEKQTGFQPVKILARPKLVAQCLSCRRSFTSTGELKLHLQTPTSNAFCSETKAQAIVGCFECKTSFTQLEKLITHIEDPQVHSPFEAKPTGRTVFIGGFSDGVTEKDIKKFFDGYVIETTSMRTHCDFHEKFAFIDLTTKEEVYRAVKQLHGKSFLGRRVVVQPQRSNRNQQLGQQSQQLKVKEAVNVAQPGFKEKTTTPQHRVKDSINISHPGLLDISQVKVKESNTNLKVNPRANLKTPPQSAQTKKSGKQPGGTSLRPGAPRFNPLGSQACRHSAQTDQNFQQAQPSLQPFTSSQKPQHVQTDWPVVNSPKMQAQVALTNKVHTTSRLFEAGYNITIPIIPSRSELTAKVKCKHCRSNRSHNDSKKNKACPKSPDHTHSYSGISHLTERYEGFSHAPSQNLNTPKRYAVALDCEMAGGWTGDAFVDNLIQLTAIDYFSGEILVSALVAPTHQIRQWRTRIHGVNSNDMNAAIRSGTALQGWQGARAALFAHIDDTTILVGHALHNDLNILRTSHSRVVDSEILAATAVGLHGFKHHSLKLLCKEFLGRDIQQRVHDCLEDTVATREVVMWMTMFPEQVRAWGDGVRKKEEERLGLKEEAEIAANMAGEAAEANASGIGG